tara:strand:- start:9659 stop:10084 length:426 start_codon:yes stop_codon:yes gene_type:complete
MTTKRETILARIKTVLAGTTGVSDRIFRSRQTAFTRGETPSLVIEPQNDSVEQNTSLPTLHHTLSITISVVVRSSTPHQTADPVVESLHSRIMADLTVNGNAIDVKPAETTFNYIDADQTGLVVGCNYDIIYRTNVDDLSQ